MQFQYPGLRELGQIVRPGLIAVSWRLWIRPEGSDLPQARTPEAYRARRESQKRTAPLDLQTQQTRGADRSQESQVGKG